MSKKILNENNRRTYLAILYLLWNLTKKQKAMFITLIAIFSLLILPFDLLVFINPRILVPYSAEYSYLYSTAMMLTCFFIPAALTLLSLPMIQSQISTSSLIKRIGSTRITPKQYSISIVLLYTVLSTLTFYVLFIIMEILMLILNININESFLGIIFFAPILFSLFSATGIMIGSWRMNQMIKGILVIAIILLIYAFGYIVYNPLSHESEAGMANFLTWILIIDPWTLSPYIMNTFFDASIAFNPLQTFILILFMISFDFFIIYFSTRIISLNNQRK